MVKTSPAILFRRRVVSKARAIELYVTSECTLACRHCCTDFKNRNAFLPRETIYELLKEAKTLDVEIIHITGGEPFLRKDILKILSKMLNLDYYVTLVTSGQINLSRLQLKKLKEFSDTGSFELLISIDGMRKEHEFLRGEGTYKRSLSFALNSLLVDINLAIITCVSRINIKTLPTFIYSTKEYGIKNMVFLYFTPTGRGKMLKEFLVPLRLWKKTMDSVLKIKGDINIDYEQCYLPKKHLKKTGELCKVKKGELLCLSPDGVVFPCILLKDFPVGVFKKGQLHRLWYRTSKMPQLIHNNIRNNINCEDVVICGGGCVGFSSHVINGNLPCDERCEKEINLYPICPLVFHKELRLD